MKNLFTMGELITATPCKGGLTRLTSGLGTYSGPTTITTNDLGPLIFSDILWCVKLLPIPDHKQKVLCVKTAIFAANSVAHLTDDPHAKTCIAVAQAWLDNPCEETRADAEAAEAEADYTYAAYAAAYYTTRAATTRAIAIAAADAAYATTFAVAAAADADGDIAASRAKMKDYLISLIKELDV